MVTVNIGRGDSSLGGFTDAFQQRARVRKGQIQRVVPPHRCSVASLMSSESEQDDVQCSTVDHSYQTNCIIHGHFSDDKIRVCVQEVQHMS